MFDFDTNITYLTGIGPAKALMLQKEMGVFNANQLLNLFPNRYVDKSKMFTIRELQAGNTEVQIKGIVTDLKEVKQKRGSRLVATFKDETGSMELIWFRVNRWLKTSIKINEPYVIFGKLNFFNGTFSMPHPDMELEVNYKKNFIAGLQAIYPSTEKMSAKGFNNKVMSKAIQHLIKEAYPFIQETLSQEILDEYQLLSKKEALLHIHFPKNQEYLARAQKRLKFEEFFFIQTQLIRNKLVRKDKIKGFVFGQVGDYFNDFYKSGLKFDLTNAQKRVLKEIRADMASGAHMNRLLQGDVGAGKTIVALLTILIALDNNFQTAMLAPTEILATQHFQAVSELVTPFNISVKLLTGSTRTKERRIIHESLEDGSLQILIGTHAILEDKVVFKNLGLAIIDEQHRFGVAQRSKMWMKNTLPPHVLIMTATPIPRTLAMSAYGDLDVSMIDELPPGRKPIQTVHRFDSARLRVFKFMRDEIEKGRQIYVVYPLIEESEAMDYKDLQDGYESIQREFPLPKYRISIVHGKMKPADKELEMQRFVKGETQIMVATTVIEVGVNVPNASVMIIESAERFGLSQLHQLRGRVGRGADQSYCILMSGVKLSNDSKTRLETMVRTSDGFEIAEVDLKLRGPGNLMGTQQSGVLNLKIADLVRDSKELHMARNTALEVLREDPNLTLTKNLPIKKAYQQIHKRTSIWANIS
ncbi:ATP-dependent DNA helicase RecG [Wenyingzhuangia marina]|uniref:ATP-dependent DNA helicase RecG n=1 Tax=Wenyingzhuangia marina TaxID=1195760 RepID=A0A1M5VXT2_9FLAO|nr:ATP-dependent DNA helicase RecG [Wenyingzhuangia marina]GGF77274.1 ATP-dependent DNA helicase RecG [Wenyingzhuangia marina]SHH79804.1 ATP-dependent DNA helicase RecG [Wenyingzhuangia marina]